MGGTSGNRPKNLTGYIKRLSVACSLPSMLESHYGRISLSWRPPLTHPARATYDETTRISQDRFLKEYREVGNISEAASIAGINGLSPYIWRRENVLGFHQRFLDAREEYADYLESLARKRVENPSFNGRIGSDVLLIAQLNAKRPGEYRPNVTITHDLGKRVMEVLAQAQARDRSVVEAEKARSALPEPSVLEVLDDEKTTVSTVPDNENRPGEKRT